ncbi:MAG: hypothetical protein JRN24_04200, partial [Nitrososphaerota archaeon]|nr:hypothetical protein [Nitrososphaerota archaeon]
MSEGLDKRDDSGEGNEETLEDLREELLEKYGDGEAAEEPPIEALPEGEASSEPDEPVQPAEVPKGESDEDHSSDDRGETDGFDAEAKSKPMDSTLGGPEAEDGERGDSAEKLEEFRQKLTEESEHEDGLQATDSGDESNVPRDSKQEEPPAAEQEADQAESYEGQPPESEAPVEDRLESDATQSAGEIQTAVPPEAADESVDSDGREVPAAPDDSTPQSIQEESEPRIDHAQDLQRAESHSELERESEERTEQKAADEAGPTSVGSEEFEQQAILEANNPKANTSEEFDSGTQPQLVEPQDLELYEFKLDDIEPRGTESGWDQDPRFFEAIEHQRGDMLRLPDSDLEGAGARIGELENREILEVELRDVSDEGASFRTVFGRYDADNRRAEVYLGSDLDHAGHEFQLEMVESYSEKKIVEDFNEHKCEHLDNVRLELEKEDVFLNVDGRRIPFEDRQLVTNGSEAALKGRIGDDDFKVSYDGTGSTVRLGRGYVVNEMRTEGDALVVNYSQSRSEKHDHRVYLEHVDEPERPSLGQFDKTAMRDHVREYDHPERIEGEYQFVLDGDAQREIAALLDDACQVNPGGGKKEDGSHRVRTQPASTSKGYMSN